MRPIVLILGILLVLVQYPLWLGKGGWLRVWDLDKQVAAQTQKNAALQARNARLEGEVKDLREGSGAIEERARYELGMVRDGEVFVQLVSPQASPAVSPSASSAASPAASPAAGASAPSAAAQRR